MNAFGGLQQNHVNMCFLIHILEENDLILKHVASVLLKMMLTTHTNVGEFR